MAAQKSMRSNRSERSGLQEGPMVRGDYGGTVSMRSSSQRAGECSNRGIDGSKKVFEKDRSGKMLEVLVKRRNPAKRRHATQILAQSSTGSCEAQGGPAAASKNTDIQPPSMRLQ